MAFNDLPPRPEPIFEAAIAYADTVLQRSKDAAHSGALAFYADLPFGPDYNQKVDVYAPLSVPNPLPVLMFLHGGAFIGGYKEWMGFMAPAIVATPALLVSVSYRLAPENPFPAPLEDTAAAVAWVYRNVSEYGGDPSRIFIGGHSAGGHLASLVALDNRWLASHELPNKIINGVIAVSAPLDMDFDIDNPDDAAAINMRRVFVPREEDVALANPMAHIKGQAPPFYLSVGDCDLWHLADDMIRFSAALRKAGGTVIDEVFPSHDHFDTSTRCIEDDHPWLLRTRNFMRTGVPQ